MKTVGEILQKARIEKNLDYEAVEKKTRIRKKFLEALENNEWQKLPSPTYIKGFIRNYSNFLGLKPEEMVAIFRRQYTDEERAKINLPKLAESLQEPLIKITPQRMVYIATFLFIIIFVSYLISQYRAFTGAPVLNVQTPKEGEVFSKDTILISGNTDKDAQVYINNQKISVDEKGNFQQEVLLNSGVNKLSIEAESKLGKRTKVTRTIQIESP